MLCHRVLKILEKYHLTRKECATRFGVTHKTFVSWLSEKGERNLWHFLPLFLEWYPEISRQWLYFGEGEMLGADGTVQKEIEELRMKNAQLEADLREADRVNRKLTARLLIDGVGDTPDVPNTEKTGDGV